MLRETDNPRRFITAERLLALTLLFAFASPASAFLENKDRKGDYQDAQKEAKKGNDAHTPQIMNHLGKMKEHLEKAEEERKNKNEGKAKEEEEKAKMEQMKAQKLQEQKDANQKTMDKNRASEMLVSKNLEDPLKQLLGKSNDAITVDRERRLQKELEAATAGATAKAPPQNTASESPEIARMDDFEVPKKELQTLVESNRAVDAPLPEPEKQVAVAGADKLGESPKLNIGFSDAERAPTSAVSAPETAVPAAAPATASAAPQSRLLTAASESSPFGSADSPLRAAARERAEEETVSADGRAVAPARSEKTDGDAVEVAPKILKAAKKDKDKDADEEDLFTKQDKKKKAKLAAERKKRQRKNRVRDKKNVITVNR